MIRLMYFMLWPGATANAPGAAERIGAGIGRLSNLAAQQIFI